MMYQTGLAIPCAKLVNRQYVCHKSMLDLSMNHKMKTAVNSLEYLLFMMLGRLNESYPAV